MPDAMVKRIAQDVLATVKADPLIQAGNFRKAMEVAEKTDSALSTIMRYGMSRIATAFVGSWGVSMTTTPSAVVTKLGLQPRSLVLV